MSGSTVAVFQNHRSFGVAPGSQSYTAAGTYSWVAPTGVTKVSIVAVGGGAKGKFTGCATLGGGGGGLGYKNNYAVTPGSSYSVVVGGGCGTGKDSYFVSTAVVAGKGGTQTIRGCGYVTAGAYVGDGGGNGGFGWSFTGCFCGIAGPGAGGAGGYSGTGGAAGAGVNTNGACGSGGGGGGGKTTGAFGRGDGGGGVGILGQGSNGAGGTGSGGGGGSGGASASGSCGGSYGGGGAYSCAGGGKNGGGGAVRIIWPGCSRSFPSTCVGSP